MPTLSGTQLTLLRSQPHKSKLYLHVNVPTTHATALVNDGSIGRGARIITYDNASAGWTTLEQGMTLWVGSALGGYELGRVRVLSVDTTLQEITVAENYDVAWVDNAFLTLKKEWLMWAKYPRIVNATVYQDYGTAYSTQTQEGTYPPVVVMGSNAAQLLTGASVNVYFDASESYCVDSATVASAAWVFPSGTPATSALVTPGNVSWSVAGDYWVRCIVTNSNGTTNTGHRLVSIVDPSSVFVDFELSSFSGEIDGGWEADIRVWQSCTRSQFPDGASVTIFTADTFGTTAGSVGFEANRANVLFSGYITDDSVSVNPQTSEVSFKVESAAGIGKRLTGWPTLIEDKNSAGNWNEGEGLTIQRAYWYVANFYSTLAETHDIILEADTTPIKVADFPKAPIFEQLANFAKGTRFARTGVTKQGRVIVGRDPQIMSAADRLNVDTVCTLQHGDWREAVGIEERRIFSTSFIDMSGVAYSGTPSDELVPVFSKAYNAPANYGSDQQIDYLVFVDQDEANTICGNVFAQFNNPYPEITLVMAGDWSRAFDPAYQEYVIAPTAGFDTKRGTLLASSNLIVRRMSIAHDNRAGVTTCELTCEVESSGVAALVGDYPQGVPTEVTLPPVDVVTPDNGGGWANTWRAHLVTAWQHGRVYETFDFGGTSFGTTQPHWEDISSGLSVGATDSIRIMIGDAWQPDQYQFLVQNTGNGLGTNSILYKREGRGIWNPMVNAVELSGQNFSQITALMTDIAQAGWLGAYVYGDTPNAKLYYVESADRGVTWSAPVQITNNVGNIGTIRTWTQMGVFQGTSAIAAGQVIYCAVSLGTADGKIFRSTNRGAAWALRSQTCPFYDGSNNLYVDPANHDIIFVYGADVGGAGSGTNGLKRSTDGGATFGAVQLSGEANQGFEALNLSFNNETSGTTGWYFFGSNANYKKLYKTTNTGSSYTNTTGAGDIPATATGAPFMVSTVYDAPGKLYGFPYAQVASNSEARVFISDDDGANWKDRSGAAGSRIEYTAGGNRGFLQVWNEGGL